MNNWRDLKAIWGFVVLVVGFVLFLAIAAISSLMPSTEQPKPLVPEDVYKVPVPEPELPDRGGDQAPVSPDETDGKEPETSDIPAGDQESENSPCECTPTCPCDAEHCECRGKERCSEVCPCHKKIAKFYCPTCKRNGYCDYDPADPMDRPHRVCRDCKLWMDRLEPPMSEKEFKAVIYWRNQQRWMQAQKEQAAEKAQRHYQRPAPMPTYNPWPEYSPPVWQPRRMFRQTTAIPASGCPTWP